MQFLIKRVVETDLIPTQHLQGELKHTQTVLDITNTAVA